MIKIAPKLWIGSQADFEQLDQFGTDWAIVHACKEPHHRKALGYSSKAAPKDHPEYLVARRDNRLILNLIDADDAKYVPKELIDAAVSHIADSLTAGSFVLCHCNQGASRSPTIGLLYLAPTLPEHFESAESQFRAVYPAYAPSKGLREFAKSHWQAYRQRLANKVSTADAASTRVGVIDRSDNLRCGTCKHWSARREGAGVGFCMSEINKDGRYGFDQSPTTTDHSVCSNWATRDASEQPSQAA